MRKKQSVTQRVLAEECRPIREEEEEAPADAEKPKDPENVSNKDDPESKPSKEDDAMSDLIVIQAPSVRAEAIVDDDEGPQPSKTGSKPSDVMENLFDEDGNAILPDGTLIIQPTDVDGDRSACGPAPPAEGSSLQFDFKDGNPDPKLKLAANVVNTQSAQGNVSSGAGSISNSEPGVLDVVKCTTCTAKLNPYHKDDLAVHPVLKVITCKRCMRWYNSVEWSKDEDGKDNQCRWCGEGGQLICCDVCHNTFCKTCIKRNLGRTVLQEIEDLPEDALWRCYVCDQAPLLSLQQGCAQILEKVEAYRIGKLQRKYRLQAGKKQTENKKPPSVTPGVTPPTATIRPPLGVRMPASTLISSTPLSVTRPSIAPAAMNSQQRQQFSRLLPSVPRGNVPRSVLPSGSGVRFMGSSAGMSAANRPMSNIISSAPVRYPTPSVGRPPSSGIRPVRPAGRLPTAAAGPQPRAIRMVQGAPAMTTSAAGSSAATEEWYEQNCSLREILREVNSVDPNNIELGLKTTLKELQSWTRKCNHLENELRGAVNDAQRRTVVHKFKSTFRLNLLLRLGKIYTLMQKESGLQMAVAAQRTSVTAAQGLSHGQPSGNPTTAAKKLIVPSARNTVPVTGPRGGASGSGAVIDLTEDNATGSGGKVWVSAANNSATGLRISSVVGKADAMSKVPTARPPTVNQRLSGQAQQQPQSSTAQASNHVTSSTMLAKTRQRVTSSAPVTLLSSEEEDEEDFDGMVDDRSDKTWTSNVSRVSGTRRKSARLAAKTTPTSATEGSESSQGVEDGEDSRSRSPSSRSVPGRRNKTSKTGSSAEDGLRLTLPTEDVVDVADNSNSATDLNTPEETKDENDRNSDNNTKEEKPSEAPDNSSNDVSSIDEKKSDSKNEKEGNHENGDTVVPNGINNENSLNEGDENEGEDNSKPKVERSCDNLFTLETPSEDVSSNFIDELCDSIDNPFSREESSVKANEVPSEIDVPSTNDEHPQGNEMQTSNMSSACADSTMFDSPGVGDVSLPGADVSGDANDVDDDSQIRSSKKCITVSMWGPTTDNDELVIGSSPVGDKDDGVVGGPKGKRRASELDDSDEKAKRQKLDQ